MSAVAPLPINDPLPSPRPRPQQGANRREMVKTTADAARPPRTPQRPNLQVVPRRRRAVGLVAVVCVLLFALLLGATAFQTQIAAQQLKIDQAAKDVQTARERYDNLRRQRAELRSPNRLSVEATKLGMVPAENGEFMTIEGDITARVRVAAGDLPERVQADDSESFDHYSQIKASAGAAP